MEPNNQPFPNMLQAIGIVLIVMGILYASMLLYGVLIPWSGGKLGFLMPYMVGSILSLWAVWSWSKQYGDTKKFSYRISNIKVVVWIVLATLALELAIIFPLSTFLPVSDSTRATLQHTFGAIDIWMLMAMVLAAPFFEEHIFRGILLDGLLKNYHPVLAIVVSSLLFGVMHVNPIQFFSAFIGGLFLGWIYFRSGSMSYCMLIHFVVNLLGYLIIRYFGLNELLDFSVADLFGGTFNAVISITGGAVVLITCLYFLDKELKEASSSETLS